MGLGLDHWIKDRANIAVEVSASYSRPLEVII